MVTSLTRRPRTHEFFESFPRERMDIEFSVSFLFLVSIFGYFLTVLLAFYLCECICVSQFKSFCSLRNPKTSGVLDTYLQPAKFETSELGELDFQIYEVTFLDCSCVKTCCPCPAISLRQLRRRLCPVPVGQLHRFVFLTRTLAVVMEAAGNVRVHSSNDPRLTVIYCRLCLLYHLVSPNQMLTTS